MRTSLLCRFNGTERKGMLPGMSALAIQQMSWDEKLRTMEELWESLSREESRLESPPWHKEALRETAARHEAGQERPIDWAAAKRELRKRAE
jgi:hypothetical protein